MSGVYGLLDLPDRPWGVGAVVLSKILHRKRPNLFMIYDRHVRSCYTTAPSAPVPTDPGRSWAAYMAQLARAVCSDLQQQERLWRDVALSAGVPDAVPPLRLLDTVARRAGRDVRPGTKDDLPGGAG